MSEKTRNAAKQGLAIGAGVIAFFIAFAIVRYVTTQITTPTPSQSQEVQEVNKDIWGYPYEFQGNFMAACEAEGSKPSDCSCAFRVLEEGYAYMNVVELERQGIYPDGYLDKVYSECSQS